MDFTALICALLPIVAVIGVIAEALEGKRRTSIPYSRPYQGTVAELEDEVEALREQVKKQREDQYWIGMAMWDDWDS